METGNEDRSTAAPSPQELKSQKEKLRRTPEIVDDHGLPCEATTSEMAVLLLKAEAASMHVELVVSPHPETVYGSCNQGMVAAHYALYQAAQPLGKLVKDLGFLTEGKKDEKGALVVHDFVFKEQLHQKEFFQEALKKGMMDRKSEVSDARNEQDQTLSAIRDETPCEVIAALLQANIIEKSGIGNCGEQAMVAYKYLLSKGVRGLCMITLGSLGVEHKPSIVGSFFGDPAGLKMDKTLLGNHTFVVCGIDPSREPVKGCYPLDKSPDWGPNACVCDPWNHDWFRVNDKQWSKRIGDMLHAAAGREVNNEIFPVDWQKEEKPTHVYVDARAHVRRLSPKMMELLL